MLDAGGVAAREEALQAAGRTGRARATARELMTTELLTQWPPERLAEGMKAVWASRGKSTVQVGRPGTQRWNACHGMSPYRTSLQQCCPHANRLHWPAHTVARTTMKAHASSKCVYNAAVCAPPAVMSPDSYSRL